MNGEKSEGVEGLCDRCGELSLNASVPSTYVRYIACLDGLSPRPTIEYCEPWHIVLCDKCRQTLRTSYLLEREYRNDDQHRIDKSVSDAIEAIMHGTVLCYATG
jgi:hypothetical protein